MALRSMGDEGGIYTLQIIIFKELREKRTYNFSRLLLGIISGKDAISLQRLTHYHREHKTGLWRPAASKNIAITETEFRSMKIISEPIFHERN